MDHEVVLMQGTSRSSIYIVTAQNEVMSVFEIELIKEEMQVFIKPDVQNVFTQNSEARCILFNDQLLFTNQNKVITINNEVFINSENHIVGISES